MYVAIYYILLHIYLILHYFKNSINSYYTLVHIIILHVYTYSTSNDPIFPGNKFGSSYWKVADFKSLNQSLWKILEKILEKHATHTAVSLM